MARLHIFPQYKVFPLSFWCFSFLVRMGGFREAWTTSDSDDFQLAQSQFVTYRKKHEKKDFVNEEFLHKKINNKDVYIWIMVCYRRYCRRYTVHVVKAVRQCGDLTALNRSRWLNHCSWLVLTSLFCISLGFGGAEDLILVFPITFQIAQLDQV